MCRWSRLELRGRPSVQHIPFQPAMPYRGRATLKEGRYVPSRASSLSRFNKRSIIVSFSFLRHPNFPRPFLAWHYLVAFLPSRTLSAGSVTVQPAKRNPPRLEFQLPPFYIYCMLLLAAPRSSGVVIAVSCSLCCVFTLLLERADADAHHPGTSKKSIAPYASTLASSCCSEKRPVPVISTRHDQHQFDLGSGKHTYKGT